MKYYRKILLLFLLFIAMTAEAQDFVHFADSTGTIESEKYFSHRVVKGETAYGIARKYNVTLEEFYKVNPEAMQGIRLGEELLIPVLATPAAEPSSKVRQNTVSDDDLYIYHKVKKGETYYGIAKLYQIELADLRAANPEYDSALPEGVSLKIPYGQEVLTMIRTQQKKGVQDDNTYIVSEGETLWSISQVLQITVTELMENNPGISNAIKAGDVIDIPQKQGASVKGTTLSEKKQPFHIVKQGETLYSIARFYGVSIDSLLQYNPGIINNRIVFGDSLNIPSYRNVYDFIEYKTEKRESFVDIANRFQIPAGKLVEKNPNYRNYVPKGRIVLIPVQRPADRIPDVVTDSIIVVEEEQKPQQPVAEDIVCIGGWEKDRTYTVALMLPFASQQFQGGVASGFRKGNKASDYPFFRYIQFYQGALLALESLRDEGINVRLNVYDVSDRPNEIDRILQKPEMLETDLIIGIIYANLFNKVSDFARKQNIPLINVTSPREDILAGYPNVVKIVPSETYIPEAIMDILPDPLQMNFILAHSSDPGFQKDVDIFKMNYPYSKEFFMENSASGIATMLDPVRENYILVMSAHKVKIMDLMRVLDEKRKRYKITLIGYPRWDKISDLNYRYAQNLKLHFVVPQLIDYEDKVVNEFLYNFRARYNSEPQALAFQGYDMVNYFVRSVALFGAKCLPCLEHVPYDFISTQNIELKSTPGNGYSNTYWNIYSIEDYKTKPARK